MYITVFCFVIMMTMMQRWCNLISILNLGKMSAVRFYTQDNGSLTRLSPALHFIFCIWLLLWNENWFWF